MSLSDKVQAMQLEIVESDAFAVQGRSLGDFLREIDLYDQGEPDPYILPLDGLAGLVGSENKNVDKKVSIINSFRR